MLHPSDEYVLAKLRQRELIASADQLRAPRPLADLGRLPLLHALWLWLCAHIF